jgi:hypothetical protein
MRFLIKSLVRVKVPRIVLALVISSQMIMSPFALAAGTPPRDLPPESQPFLEMADRLEQGRQPLDAIDPMHFVGQRVELYQKGEVVAKFRLDQIALERPKIRYTLLRAHIDQENHELVIEALTGANDKGELGEIVAKHFIPMTAVGSVIKAVALAQDDETLSIIGEDSHLHVMDWHGVVRNAFRYAIPIFTDLDVPVEPHDYAGLTVKAFYVTPGTKPISEAELAGDAIIMHDESGKWILPDSGDLVVMTQAGSEMPKVRAVYHRMITHEYIAHWSRIYETLGSLLAQDNRYNEDMADALKSEEAKHEDFLEDLKSVESAASANPLIAAAMRSMGPDEIAGFAASASTHSNLAKRDTDWFSSFEDWQKVYESVLSGVDKYNSDPKNKRYNRNISPAQVAREWKVGLEQNATYQQPKENDNRISGYAYLAIAATAYMASPHLFEMTDAYQKVEFINWIYQHLYPPVLKDATYRSTLIMSTIALAAFWPEGVLSSWITGKVSDIMNATNQDTDSAVGRAFRDFGRKWGHTLSTWRRITTTSCRAYAETVLAFWIHGIERIGRQKTFFTALNNGLDPFEKILPESPIGQQVGLTEPSRLGLINPFAPREEYAEDVNIKTALMGAKKFEKDRLRSHAWLLSAMVIAEKYKIDLATLMLLEENPGKPSIEVIHGILTNPKARQEWKLLTQELQQEIVTLPYQMQNGDGPKTDYAEMGRQFQIARDLLEKISNRAPIRKNLNSLWIDSGYQALAFKNWLLNLGRNEFDTLKIITTNEWVSNQVRLDFISDHMIGIYLVALFGERADLSHPDRLSANADSFLWTPGAHKTDTATNTQIHLLFQGARMALVYQTLRAKIDDSYLPREDVQLLPRYMEQKLLSAIGSTTKEWIKPWESDMGGLALTSWTRYISTVQSTLVMQFLMRASFGQQTLSHAGAAAVGFFLNAIWWFAYPSFISGSMSQIHARIVGSRHAELKDAIRLLSWSARSSDPIKKKQWGTEGLAILRSLYEKYDKKDLAEFDRIAGAITPDQMTEESAALMFALSKPPVPAGTNKFFVGNLSFWLSAAATTYLGIDLSVFLYNPDNLTVANGVWAIKKDVFFMALAYLGLSKNAWNVYRQPSLYYEKLKGLFKEKPTCEAILEKQNPPMDPPTSMEGPPPPGGSPAEAPIQ